MIKFVKLIAKPNTWFKEGTGVFDYDYPYEDKRRITLNTFERSWKPFGIILVRGIRVCDDNPNGMGYTIGYEREDGEQCSIDEFEVEIIEY